MKLFAFISRKDLKMCVQDAKLSIKFPSLLEVTMINVTSTI